MFTIIWAIEKLLLNYNFRFKLDEWNTLHVHELISKFLDPLVKNNLLF